MQIGHILLLGLSIWCLPSNGQDPQPCPENPITLHATEYSQFVYSPYDERKLYPPKTDCRFILIAANTQRRIHATVIESSLEEPLFTDCDDYVSVRDGPDASAEEIARWCGSEHPPSFTSSGEALYIHFHSDEVIQRRGFNLSFVDFDLPGCPAEWVSNDDEGNCYHLFILPQGNTWLDAQKYCAYERSNLLTLSSSNEYSYVVNQFSRHHTLPWIGYHDAGDEGTFSTFDGFEPRWPENFPNFGGGHDTKDCVFFDWNIKDGMAYAIDDCRNRHSFICKKRQDGSTVSVTPPVKEVREGYGEVVSGYAIWMFILAFIIFLLLILCIAYLVFRKHYKNRIVAVDQNQRLVSNSNMAPTMTTVTVKPAPQPLSAEQKRTMSGNGGGRGVSSVSLDKRHVHERHGLEKESSEKLREHRSTRDQHVKSSKTAATAVTNQAEITSPRFDMTPNQPLPFTTSRSANSGEATAIVEKAKKETTVIDMPEESRTVNKFEEANTQIAPAEERTASEHEEEEEEEEVLSDHQQAPPLPDKKTLGGPLFSHSVPLAEEGEVVEKKEAQTATADNTVQLEDAATAPDPTVISMQSEDFDGLQMSPMNPHTQKKRSSHIHILNNVHAKTREEFR